MIRSVAPTNALAVALTAIVLLAASAAQGQDVSAPGLADASVAPPSFDVTAGDAGGTLTTRILDDASGFASGGAFFVAPDLGGFSFVPIEAAHRVSGDALDGIYESPMTVPESSRAGAWSVFSLTLTDGAGNAVDLPAASLPPGLGFEVVSNEDLGPPTLASLSVAPGGVDVTAGPGGLTLTAVLSDDESGVAGATVTFESPSGAEQIDASVDAGHLVAGDALSGTYEAPFEVPQLSENGTWVVANVHLVDAFGHSSDLPGATLPPAAAPSFDVTSSPDGAPPTMVWLTAEPVPVNLLDPPTTLTLRARIVDGVTGLASAGLLLESPVEAVGTAGAFDADDRISGDALDGIYETSLVFDSDAPLGFWSLRVSLADAAGNGVLLEGGAIPGPTGVSVAILQACQNGQDDDGDGLVDLADPGCASPTDASELGTAACDDGVDNDGDGAVDAAEDADCRGPADASETPDCSDGLDNDGDGFVDAADPACIEPSRQREDPPCDDGLDNDGDGLVDYPADPHCSSPADGEGSGCGLGAGLAVVVPALRRLRRRRLPHTFRPLDR